MMKRSFFLALAAGLIASVAFTAPSQAGSIVFTTAYFAITPGSATTSEIDFFYQDSGGGALSSITNIVILNTGTLTSLTPTIIGTDQINFTFDPANSTDGSIGPPPTAGLEFSFETDNAVGNVFLKSMDVIVSPSSVVAQSVSVLAVPEPASLALLGIGMTGFLALRRFFKKTSVA
jgi:hypothetical protein